MTYHIRHATTYQYATPVDLADHVLHLSPRETMRQRVLSYELSCMPTPERRQSHTDHFGNHVEVLAIEDTHAAMSLVAQCTVEVTPPLPLEPEKSPPWEDVRDSLNGDGFPAAVEAAEFTCPSPLVPKLAEAATFALVSFPPQRPFAAGLTDLTQRIFREFTFSPGSTGVSTPVAEVFAHRRGVCQDFTHVQLACLRSLGLAGRYVSGYLRTLPPPGKPRLIGADASHAWVAGWCPYHGWIDVDPTNDLLVAQEHVTVAWGRDFSDVSPVSGVILGGGSHSLDVAVQMDELP